MPQTNIAQAQKRARRLGVTVKPSSRKYKKLDVFKGKKKIVSIGDLRYSDFLQHKNEKRRALYKKRHDRNRHTPGTAGFYADKILW